VYAAVPQPTLQNMPTRSTPGPSLQLAVAVGGFIAAVACAAVVGVVLAVSLLTGSAAGHATHAAAVFGVAEDVTTSFGYVAVEHAETVKGLTAKQLAGAVHGIGSYVPPEKALVTASITLRNGVQGPTDYQLSQFTLRATTKKGAVKRYPVSHATVADGTLQPDAAVDARLAFVVPRENAKLAIEFDDPAAKAPIVIELDDDDCDGKVTEADIPEIVFSTFSGGAYFKNGTLHAISIVGGQVVDKWAKPNVVQPGAGLAAGDLDGDGVAEIVGCMDPGPGGTACCDAIAQNTGVVAFRADGSTFWTQPDTTKVHCGYESPAIGDVDGDGKPEIVFVSGNTAEDKVKQWGWYAPTNPARTSPTASPCPRRCSRRSRESPVCRRRRCR